MAVIIKTHLIVVYHCYISSPSYMLDYLAFSLALPFISTNTFCIEIIASTKLALFVCTAAVPTSVPSCCVVCGRVVLILENVRVQTAPLSSRV